MEPGDGVRGRDGAAAGGATADTSAPGGCASGCALSLQAVCGAAAAQLPPALRVLHGDGGAPLHVHLPVLPGQHLHSLRGRHARRCQLPAWAPLHLWQHPQEEAAPAAAGPGEPCRVGVRCCGGPQWPLPCCRALSPWLGQEQACGVPGAGGGDSVLSLHVTATSVLHRAVPWHTAVPCHTVQCHVVLHRACRAVPHRAHRAAPCCPLPCPDPMPRSCGSG